MTKENVSKDRRELFLWRSTSARLFFGVLCLVSCRPHPHLNPSRVTRHRDYFVPECCQATCPMSIEYDRQADVITICPFGLCL